MEVSIDQVTGPTNPDDFVGRSNIIDAYTELIRDFIREKPTVRWIHISGEAGTGKSSLLRKLRMETELERVPTNSVEVPLSPQKANQFLTEIKQVLDEMSPEWRGFIRKYRNSDIYEVLEPPEANDEEVTDDKLSNMLSDFFKDLDKVNSSMKEEEDYIGIFLDDFDRLLKYNYTSILQLFPRLMEKAMEISLNVIFVTAGHKNANSYLGLDGKEPSYVKHFELEQFDFNEADLMLRRRNRLPKSDREEVVQASTRFPADLAIRLFVKDKDYSPNTLDAKTLTEVFGFTQSEVTLLEDLTNYEQNYFNIEQLSRSHTEELIRELANQFLFLISEDDTHFVFESNSLWELVSHVYKPVDARTEAKLILDRVKNQAQLGQLPLQRDLDVLNNRFRNIKDNNLLFELSGQLSDAARAALDEDLVQTAWDLLELATIGLERTGDWEKVADLQESLAKGFDRAGYDYFAAQAFEKAGEYYAKADIEWKSQTNYREAGTKFLREAENASSKFYHYAIRSILKNSFEAYLKADEQSRAKRVIRSAKDLLKDYPQHIDYFEKMEVR